jgi:hypothetical protein
MRRLVVLALVAMAVSAVSSGASALVYRHRDPTLLILVVAGQSNALGYQSFVIDPATHKDVFTEKGSSPADHKAFFTFEESGVAGGALPPVPLDTPQRRAGTTNPIFGPELGLARYLYGMGHKDLLIVKVAFSGSSLAVDWAPHDKDYESLLTRVQAAVSWASHHGWSPTVGGFYWMQGESDATVAAYAADYRIHLLKFIANVRRSLRLTSTTPFVIGQIDLADFINFEQAHRLCETPDCSREKLWNAEVMDAQASVAGTNVFVAETATLPRYEHFLHLTDAAELALGAAFGKLSRSHV